MLRAASAGTWKNQTLTTMVARTRQSRQAPSGGGAADHAQQSARSSGAAASGQDRAAPHTKQQQEHNATSVSDKRRPAKRQRDAQGTSRRNSGVQESSKADTEAADAQQDTAKAPAQDASATAGKQDCSTAANVALHAHPSDNKDFSPYYLMKNEPDDFSIDDLAEEPEQTTCWEGVRNFKARNIIRAMQPGQQCFFYHSNCKDPGIVGIMEVARAAYPDHTQFDKTSRYYDAKSSKDDPRWSMVDVKLVRKLTRAVTLNELKRLKGDNEVVAGMQLFTTARLSIQNVTQPQWVEIVRLSEAPE